MPRMLGLLPVIVLAAIFTPASFADEAADWIETRSLSKEALLLVAENDTGVSDGVRIQALLTLADRGINSSTTEATEHLERAEPLISPGTDAVLVAKAIRCQLEHRQSLSAAEKTCQELNDSDLSPHNRFIQAFVYVTKMYYFYRVGEHELSLESAELALECAAFVDDPALLSAAHNMIGLNFSTRLRPRMSVHHFEKALEHAARLPYTAPKTITQLNLASSYTYLGRGEEALQMLEEASATPMVKLYATREMVVQSMIGHARVAIGETQGAEEELQQVVDRVSDVVLPDGMTFGYTSLGLIQLAENRPHDALASFNKVLEVTGKNFESDLDYSRIQLVAVPYAAALRESGRVEESRKLLRLVIKNIPQEEPDQLLVDAYKELELTLATSGDEVGAQAAHDNASKLETRLWDASFEYQIARLNASLESDRRTFELERARERAIALQDIANRESTLRRQTWLIGAMVIAVIALFFSHRLQKRIADTERAASVKLDSLVKERTQELEDEMVKRMAVEVERRQLAERMFEGEKLRSMGQLTAGVAHDFNNLMTVVTLGADQLKTGMSNSKDPETAETLEHIRSAADTGAKITRGLLAYVREQPLQPEKVELDVFLREALPMFRNTLGERFTLAVNLVTCSVVVDKGQLTSAILNLLLNSKEAMADGGQIAVTLRNFNGQAQIEVRDNGSGMSPEVLKHAFDPFFTTKDNEEGSGLGLSMVYGFARQSNGDLTIDSAPNKGTWVTLSLPLAPNFVAEKADVADHGRRIPKGIQILAVEDRAQLLTVIERSLSQLGAHVACAASADVALDMVANTGLPDLLITDIVMPGKLDGLDLVAKLREMDPALPVLLMSGYSRDVDNECTFLHKPFSFDELEDAIEKALNESAVSYA